MILFGFGMSLLLMVQILIIFDRYNFFHKYTRLPDRISYRGADFLIQGRNTFGHIRTTCYFSNSKMLYISEYPRIDVCQREHFWCYIKNNLEVDYKDFLTGVESVVQTNVDDFKIELL